MPSLPSVKAQITGSNSASALEQLLARPAPTPRLAGVTEVSEKTPRQRPPQFFAKDNAPPDDAPIEDLLEFWYRLADESSRPNPSQTVRQRLWDACQADTERMSLFLPLFPQTEAIAAKIKEIYDRESGNQDTENYVREKVKKWLLFNTRYFITDLFALASKAKDNDKFGHVEKEVELTALAQVDWTVAEPLLQSLLNGSQQRAAALALTLLYKQARTSKDADLEEKYRVRLQAIAADRGAPARARGIAIEALSLTEWSGCDEWYLSLFADETLTDPYDGSSGFSPLTTLFVSDPDKWIPVMARLVKGKDITIRSAAASCLIRFQNETARKDALAPLLPWISDPEWATTRLDHRLRLIQSMENVDLPESVPGLIWAVEHDPTDYNRSYAAESLARYKDPQAGPALKRALAAQKGDSHRRLIIRGLLACQGLTESEQVEALEAYAERLTTPEGRDDVSAPRDWDAEPLPVPVSIGMFLSRMQDVPASLVRTVLARATTLQKSNPPLAQSLLQLAQQWQGRQIDLDMIDRIASGTADATTIANALGRRTKLRESVGPELQNLVGSDGAAPGVAAVLLEDISLAQSVLSSGSEPAKVGLLACARLTQMSLPVESIGALMQNKNQLLARAAESYLLAEDSKEARRLVWARHQNEAFVTGWRESVGLMNGNDFGAMAKVEENLRGELFKQNAPVEIFALVANDDHDSRVLRVYPDRAVYTFYENPARYRERVVPQAELVTFKEFLAANKFEDLGPQIKQCHHNCWTAEYLTLTREKGRRVFSEQRVSGWATMVASFDALGRGDGARIHYHFETQIKGLEVLYAEEKLAVKDVWASGADIRLFVERVASPEELERPLNPVDADDADAVSAARAEYRRQKMLRERARFSWRAWTNHQVAGAVSQPTGYATFDNGRFPLGEDEDEPDSEDYREVQQISADSIVVTRYFDGLWRQTAGQKAVRVSGEGAYARPIVTPDGKWVVVAKADGSGWGGPNGLVRFNLNTGREYRVNLPPAEHFFPVAYVAPHGRVLLRRARDDYQPSPKSVGPETPEYYLLDAATGQTQLVSGVFAPLMVEGKRFLQPTGKPNEFWAAIPDQAKNQTQVGHYNLKDFSFQSQLVVPHITFDSMSTWADEPAAKLYLVFEGQLIRMPLPGAR